MGHCKSGGNNKEKGPLGASFCYSYPGVNANVNDYARLAKDNSKDFFRGFVSFFSRRMLTIMLD